MNSFKDIAYQILKEAGKLLHSKEITKIALQKGWLKTAGKTPEATMNAQLVVNINSKKEKSRFIKTAPSTKWQTNLMTVASSRGGVKRRRKRNPSLLAFTVDEK